LVLDAERCEAWFAPVARSADAPPVLGQWEALTPENGYSTGPFVEPLQQAMR
jgi:hypothetical protein